MSDVNNAENMPKKSFGLIKFVIIYMIIAILLTFSSVIIYRKTGKNLIVFLKEKIGIKIEEEKETLNSDIVEKSEKIEPSNIKDKYAKNNIELKEVYEEINKDFVYETEEDKEYKNRIRYYQISGLKNKEVENRINNDIKQKVRALINEEEKADSNVEYITVDSYISANYSNVLSIHVFKNLYYFEGEDIEFTYEGNWLGLNYRLDTGEELKFNDLFNEKASIKKMLSQALYETLAFEYASSSMDYWEPDMDTIDYSKIELDIFRIIDNYNKNNDINFYFSETTITTILNNKYIGINMYDNNEYMIIFNLVKPKKSLFENGDLEKKDYVFLTPYLSNTVVFQKITSDVFLSIFSPYDKIQSLEAYEDYKKVVDENLNYIVALIKQNESREENKNGKAKIYNINYIYEWEDEVNASGQKIEVDLKNFDKEIENVYWEACCQEPSGDYMLMLPYTEENYYDIQFKEVEDSILKLYQKKGLDLNWTGSDGSIMDLYGNIIEEEKNNV